MLKIILYINNTYITGWDEFKGLIIRTFTSQTDKFQSIRDEILSSARDGLLYDWLVEREISFSSDLDPHLFIKMTDGELQELLLSICGSVSKKMYRPIFENHIEIISEYTIDERDFKRKYPISTPIPINNSSNRFLNIGLKVINPINEILHVALVKHAKTSPISWNYIKDFLSDDRVTIDLKTIDLKTKGSIYNISVNITDIKSDEAISLYSDGKYIYTFNTLPEYIDLGIGVKWATCNLGAERPNDPGDYFAWGKSKSQDNFDDKDNYCQRNNISGIVPYDAATVMRGKSWRIPNRKEWNKLYGNCDCEEVIIDDIPCMKLTSRVNKKYIILPITGYKDGDKVVNIKSSDCYWSSIKDDSYDAFDNKGSYKHKYLGLMIRPVFDASDCNKEDRNCINKTPYNHANTNQIDIVDMGTSVLWCTKNLGADQNLILGSYYSWGNLKPADYFSKSAFGYREVHRDNISGNSAFDAALTSLCKGYRIPTSKEWSDLLSVCDNKVETVSIVGEDYIKLVSKITGNYILLPIMGYMHGTDICNENIAEYWASDAYSTKSAHIFCADNTNCCTSIIAKWHGLPIRPVYDDKSDNNKDITESAGLRR